MKPERLAEVLHEVDKELKLHERQIAVYQNLYEYGDKQIQLLLERERKKDLRNNIYFATIFACLVIKAILEII